MDIPTKMPPIESILDNLKPGQVIPVPIQSKGIGGELLNILSKGLYTNPLDAIREYAQNSIDANADRVEAQVTGNSVFILDNGEGMDRKKLLQAKDFGVSQKDIGENVGFRGIGIYSGFDLCERLVIRTKTQIEKVEHILEFRFGEMRRRLDVARQDPKRPVIPLAELLSANVYYRFEESSRMGKSFTLVQLENLSDDHIHKLSNLDEIQNYVLRNLPVRFNEDFEYGEKIEKALRKNVPGYKSAKIILKIEGSKPVVIEKPNITELESPGMGFIYDSNGKELAYYWACLTKGDRALSSRGFEDFAGLVYKVKGFTIGNRERLASHFTRRQVYTWWTGEIYVIDTQVIPTSARADFESGSAKDTLEGAVRELLNGSQNRESLQKIALEAQATRRADEVIEDRQTKIDAVAEKISSSLYDEFEVYSELNNIIDDLKSQRNKASDKARANSLIKKAEALQKRAKKELDQPTPTSVRKRRAAKAAMEEETELSTPETATKARPSGQIAVPMSLLEIIKKSGWNLQREDIQLISILGDAIADTLGTNSEIYKQLIRDIETRLADLMEPK